MEENIKTEQVTKRNKPVTIPENTMIKVKSTVFGTLIYVNKRSGETFKWGGQGEILYISLRDLITMRNEAIAFFKNQWIIVLGVGETEKCTASVYDIYSALGVKDYYKNIIDPTDEAAICGWTLTEISERVAMLAPEAKDNFIVALNKFIKNGTLDSRKKIKAFEKALGCELTDE